MRMCNWLLLAGLCLALETTGCKKDQPRQVGKTVGDRFELVDDRIDDTIEDDELKDHLLLLSAENRHGIKILVQRLVALHQEGRENSNMSREELQEKLEEFAEERKRIFMEIAQTRVMMRSLLTRQQWDGIFQEESEEGGK